jgi:hypothetical protein
MSKASIGSIRSAVIATTALAALTSQAMAAKPSQISFALHVNPAFKTCLARNAATTPKATAKVVRGALNDTLTLTLTGFKPNLAFDLFTVQRTNLLPNGTVNPAFTNFGLDWYQSDVETNGQGEGSVVVKTILLDQIFGFDPDKSLAPLNTFHLGFWFNNPKDATPCGFTGFTPFNGEHHAGPLAFISVPGASHLGPLCSDPKSSNPPACNP